MPLVSFIACSGPGFRGDILHRFHSLPLPRLKACFARPKIGFAPLLSSAPRNRQLATYRRAASVPRTGDAHPSVNIDRVCLVAVESLGGASRDPWGCSGL